MSSDADASSLIGNVHSTAHCSDTGSSGTRKAPATAQLAAVAAVVRVPSVCCSKNVPASVSAPPTASDFATER